MQSKAHRKNPSRGPQRAFSTRGRSFPARLLHSLDPKLLQIVIVCHTKRNT